MTILEPFGGGPPTCCVAIKPDAYTDSYTIFADRNGITSGVSTVIDGSGDIFVVTVQPLAPSQILAFKDYIRANVSNATLFNHLAEDAGDDTCPPDGQIKRTASEEAGVPPEMEDWYVRITDLVRGAFPEAFPAGDSVEQPAALRAVR